MVQGWRPAADLNGALLAHPARVAQAAAIETATRNVGPKLSSNPSRAYTSFSRTPRASRDRARASGSYHWQLVARFCVQYSYCSPPFVDCWATYNWSFKGSVVGSRSSSPLALAATIFGGRSYRNP